MFLDTRGVPHINANKLTREYVQKRIGQFQSIDKVGAENLFIQLFDRVEALEKRMSTAATNEGEKS